MSYSSLNRGEATRLTSFTPQAVWSHMYSPGLPSILLFSNSIHNVIPFFSANPITRFRPMAQFSRPSSSDMPFRHPEKQMTLGTPASAEALMKLWK